MSRCKCSSVILARLVCCQTGIRFGCWAKRISGFGRRCRTSVTIRYSYAVIAAAVGCCRSTAIAEGNQYIGNTSAGRDFCSMHYSIMTIPAFITGTPTKRIICHQSIGQIYCESCIFSCVIPFIHSSMKSELKSDLTIFLQYKLATITPHPVSFIHAYPQYIAFKILSFCRNTEQLACQNCKKAHKITVIQYINPQWMSIKKTDINDLLPHAFHFQKHTSRP